MSNKDTSQAQQKRDGGAALPFDPSAAFSSGLEAWAKMTQEGVTRMQSFFDELAKLETSHYERTRSAADEMTKLVGDTFAYANQLSSEWRKLTLEATRRGTEALSRG